MAEPQGAVEKLKYRYYGSFVPGMQTVIAAVLPERLDDVSILKLFDGVVVFETDCSYDRLNFFCFNNIFALIDIQDYSGIDKTQNEQNENLELLEHHLKKIVNSKMNDRSLTIMAANSKMIKKFRLVCSLENTPVSVNEKLKQNVEKYIVLHSGLELDRSKPDTEFWFLYRSEGFSFFLKRLTNHEKYTPHQGELSPQLAWLLCHIAGLKHGETAADPFCGYGSIVNAACKHFPVNKVYASDADKHCVKITGSRPGLQKNGRAQIFQTDFHSILNHVQAGSVDAIVTDPPWGMYKETSVSLETFYAEMCGIFSKLLKNGGRAVVLMAAREEFENAVEKTKTLKICKTIPILVSGKKAVVFICE